MEGDIHIGGGERGREEERDTSHLCVIYLHLLHLVSEENTGDIKICIFFKLTTSYQ